MSVGIHKALPPWPPMLIAIPQRLWCICGAALKACSATPASTYSSGFEAFLVIPGVEGSSPFSRPRSAPRTCGAHLFHRMAEETRNRCQGRETVRWRLHSTPFRK